MIHGEEDCDDCAAHLFDECDSVDLGVHMEPDAKQHGEEALLDDDLVKHAAEAAHVVQSEDVAIGNGEAEDLVSLEQGADTPIPVKAMSEDRCTPETPAQTLLATGPPWRGAHRASSSVMAACEQPEPDWFRLPRHIELEVYETALKFLP